MKLTSLLAGLFVVVPALLLSGCDGGTKHEKGNILNRQASITLPAGFIKMPEDLLKTMYPQAQRPNEAWYVESEKSKVSFAFSQTAQAMTDAQLPGFAEAMKNQFSAFSPKVSEIKVNGKKAIRIEVLTPDTTNPGGTQIFNVMQFSSMNGKLLIAAFNTTVDLQEKYQQSGKAALDTLTW
ncbi:hypothetical protein [Budvicia diplopodorum]|uniref:hypothetical protein n=1 Tax=Budvicia diplopodorum TaxID=1119056 RepID=UPI001358C9DA|nr:hypothetical protein [Budvicia diplopodorum]